MSTSTSFRLLAPAAVALAFGAPAAHARPAADPPAAPAQVAPAPAMPDAPSAGDGFDWGSAAVGAGGVAGIVVLLSAGAAVAGRARVPSTR